MTSLLIVGASVRAAAATARQAGFEPLAIDRFADLDLKACCPCLQLPHFPSGLIAASRSMPAGPWMYTGPLENSPALVRRLARRRTLYGNPPHVLRRVRQPTQLARALGAEGLLYPEIRPTSAIVGPGKWLRKTRRSAGGSAVAYWRAAAPARDPVRNRGVYLQRFVPGRPVSAVFVAAAGRALLLGVSKQLIGCHWCGARGFQYAGSIGPLKLPPHETRTLIRVGATLAGQFDLQGLFGVDAVLDGGRVWTIEVNPRYSASIEVLERSFGDAFLKYHIGACRDAALPAQYSPRRGTRHGKAILFARRPLVILESLRNGKACFAWNGSEPHLADIPPTGTRIMPGQPVLTVFAAGSTCRQVEQQLWQRARQVQQFLGC